MDRIQGVEWVFRTDLVLETRSVLSDLTAESYVLEAMPPEYVDTVRVAQVERHRDNVDGALKSFFAEAIVSGPAREDRERSLRSAVIAARDFLGSIDSTLPTFGRIIEEQNDEP